MVGVRKKTPKKRNSEQNSAPEQDPDIRGGLAEEEEEDDDDAGGADEDASGEEEDGGDERKRTKLLEAINALAGRRRRLLAERSEAAVNMSEFSVSAEGESDRMKLSDLIGTIQTAPGVTAENRKQLRDLQQSRTVECPLSKQDSERIQRDVAFQKAASAVSRWGSIITQNRRAEQLVFPLDQEPSGPRPVEKVVMGWRAQTPLEQEVFALLAANKQPIHDPVLTPAEEASLRAMSLEDAKVRRAELQKARALQSYYEAKARRERKIKSKKYHKVQNKARRKDFLKQFDEMVKSDPSAALEELNRMELARMQERMSLKHQNSGKWAKSKAVMAKYDEDARRAMQQQLEVNKDLTRKMVTSQNQEEEEEVEEEEGTAGTEKLPDFVNDAEKGRDANPWMRGKLSEEPAEKEASVGAEEEEKEAGPTAGGAEEEEEEEGEEEALLREFDNKRKLRQQTDTAGEFVEEQGMEEEEQQMREVEGMEEEEEEQQMREVEGMKEEEENLAEFTKLFQGKTKSLTETEAEEAAAAELEEGLVRIRTMEDVDLLPQDDPVTTPASENAPVSENPPTSENPPASEQPPLRNRKRKKKGIELKEVLTKETKVLHVPLCPTVADSEDMEGNVDQRGLIREAFAGDDVISDFLKDKRNQEDSGKPKKVDLTLPGWGEWGGLGLKPSKTKRRRFRFKTAAPPSRRDQHLPSVIISERRDSSVSLHQVNSLPFPFQNRAQFESSIRAPLGRTWNTERTVKKVTKPKVLTQLGAIIQPMAEEELERDKEKMSAGGSGGRPESKRPKNRQKKQV